MNKINIQNTEDTLTRSIQRFETAMERLAGKVEDSSQRVQHVIEIAKHQKDELVNLKNKTREAITPAVNAVKANPRPYIIAFAGIVGGLCAASYFKKRSSGVNEFLGKKVYKPDSVSETHF